MFNTSRPQVGPHITHHCKTSPDILLVSLTTTNPRLEARTSRPLLKASTVNPPLPFETPRTPSHTTPPTSARDLPRLLQETLALWRSADHLLLGNAVVEEVGRQQRQAHILQHLPDTWRESGQPETAGLQVEGLRKSEHMARVRSDRDCRWRV